MATLNLSDSGGRMQKGIARRALFGAPLAAVGAVLPGAHTVAADFSAVDRFITGHNAISPSKFADMARAAMAEIRRAIDQRKS